VPCIKRLGRIYIYIYHADHAPPHFHARFGGVEAQIRIADLEVMFSALPKSTLRRVLEWATHHQRALAYRWDLASRGEPPPPIKD
jgi:Domain of unknown function (DUF4160)